MTTVATIRLGEVLPAHRSRLREILVATNSFRDAEIDVALELLDEGEPSYHFLGAFADDTLIGYACYGATPGTDRTWDLYWIAVHPEFQGAGGGSRLMEEVERRLRSRDARMLVVETSSRTDYVATRSFYEKRGYVGRSTIPDFYGDGDSRVIYSKRLQ